jgi:hypothetical protein
VCSNLLTLDVIAMRAAATRSRRHSNQFPTKPLFLNSASRCYISNGLGDLHLHREPVVAATRSPCTRFLQGFSQRFLGCR